MTRSEIEAAFLLAGITLYSATPAVNTYPGMQRLRGPIWTCWTDLGTFVVGYRKRVVSIDWKEIGSFTKELPDSDDGGYLRWLHRDNTDQGPDYIHAYSLPAVATYLHAFRHEMRSDRFRPTEAH